MVAIMAKATGESSFTPVSEGLHPAICTAVVDLGMQPGSAQYPDPKRQVYLRFDCLDEQVEFEKDGVKQTGPARCGATYTLSLGEKAKLRSVTESWRGRKFTEDELRGFDIAKLLGAPCQIQVLHNHKGDKTYANIQTIVPWPKGVEKPKLPADAVLYSPSEPDETAHRKLPKWLQDKLADRLGNTEADLRAQREPTQKAPVDDFDDDQEIPF